MEMNPEMVSDQDKLGMSALHEAAQAGWDDLVDILLKAGAPSSPMNNEKKTPLYYAAQNGNIEMTSLISKKESGERYPSRAVRVLRSSKRLH